MQVAIFDNFFLYICTCAADRAIREMNRKEKDIVRAYFKAVKYASQIESRVRIMLIGDEDSGNSNSHIAGHHSKVT